MADCTNPFLFVDKCRQFGFSYLCAARALAKSMLLERWTTIFVSYNEEESKEKINYAKELYMSLPTKYQLSRKLKYDNKTSLVFEKGGESLSETRVLSYPQRILRGKGGGVDVVLDEFAHCIHARKIYTSALPVISRGGGTMWVGSTPAGKVGLFYEIGANVENKYPLYLRIHVRWWDVPEFCVDVARARKEVHDMMTDERVSLYASQRLKDIRNSLPLEDFQQEYECAYLDESYSYFPWDLILKCVPVKIDAVGPDYDAPAAELSENDSPMNSTEFYRDMENFLKAVNSGHFKYNFLAGFDVGRMDDTSELVLVEEKENHQSVRGIFTFRRMSLPEQRSIVIDFIKKMGNRLIKFGIDANGIGLNLAEDIENSTYDLVVRLPFNQASWKEEACRETKYRMEFGGLTLPPDRQYLSQFHSIKRTYLPGSNTWRFDAEASGHHGDEFWGTVAASCVGRSLGAANTVYDLDKRVVTKTQGDRRLAEIHVPRMERIMRFNPYGTIGHGFFGINPPTYPGLSMPRSLVPISENLARS